MQPAAVSVPLRVWHAGNGPSCVIISVKGVARNM